MRRIARLFLGSVLSTVLAVCLSPVLVSMATTTTSHAGVFYVTERGAAAISKVTVDAAGTTTVNNSFVTGLPLNGPDSVIFDHHGQMLISNTDAGNIWRVDPSTGQADAAHNPVNKTSLQPGNPHGTIDGVADLALDPNADVVWAIGWDRSVLASVDLTTGVTTFWPPPITVSPAPSPTPKPPPPALGGIAFSSSGRLFVSSHNGIFAELDPLTGTELRSIGIEQSLDGMTFDPTTGHIFVAGSSGICEFSIGTAASPALALVTFHSGVVADGLAADGHGHILFVAPGESGSLGSLDLATGETSIIASGIPSADDVAPVIGAGAPPPSKIVLTPPTATHTVGQTTTATATVTDVNGNPVANASVTLKITGANASSLTATTDSSGKATFTYTGAHAGTDTLRATSGSAESNTAAVVWIPPPTPTPHVPILAPTGQAAPPFGFADALLGLALVAAGLGLLASARRFRRDSP